MNCPICASRLDSAERETNIFRTWRCPQHKAILKLIYLGTKRKWLTMNRDGTWTPIQKSLFTAPTHNPKQPKG